jgi:hypothetical protein
MINQAWQHCRKASISMFNKSAVESAQSLVQFCYHQLADNKFDLITVINADPCVGGMNIYPPRLQTPKGVVQNCRGNESYL